MQLIKAIIRPNKVDDVKEALEKIGVAGMTVTEVRGHGQQKGHTAVYRGKEYAVSLLQKMSIETVVADSVVEMAIKALAQSIGGHINLGLPIIAGHAALLAVLLIRPQGLFPKVT